MAANRKSTGSDGSWEFVEGKTEVNEYGLTKLPGEDVRFPVAIVGIGCRMPGVESLTDYRNLLIDGATSYGPIPEDRWSTDDWHDSDPTKLGHHVNKVAGLIPKFNYFDNLFFNTSPREAYAMDPHQYQVMECSHMALDDAGITAETIPHNTAVYMSMRMGEMILTDCENRNIPNSHILTGGAHTTAANRVSFFYDIRGGSMGVEGACSAAIASIHFGAWSLWNKECDAVLAGGVNLIWCPHFFVNQTHHGYMSASGDPSPFDAGADGRVRSEAAGVVLLKPLADAIRDGDHVHSVIRGSSLSYHGNNASITLHTPESFKHSMNNCYSQFGIPLDKIKYVEAHATGNADEDVMEAKAIGELLGQSRDKKNPVKIGSAKANLGHAESASGTNGLIKACLMLDNRELYPQANFKKLNPEIDAEGLNIEVQQTYEKYTGEDNMMVGLNVTSFAGQQCHMVLEEFKTKPKVVAPADLAGWKFGNDGSGRMLPIPLSGKNPNALKDVARQWIEYSNEEDAQVVTSWLATRRDHYLNRMVVMADSTEDLKAKLTDFIAGEPCDHIVEGKARPNFEKPKICFVFPGQGQQWWDMGRKLYADEPVYRNIIDECDKIWQKCSGYSFLVKNKVFITTGHEDADPTSVDATLAALIAIVANQLALHEQMLHWGIKPDMVVGHSLGEASSIYASGGMTLEECITNIYIRATSQNKVSGTGTMAAARFTPEEAYEFCSKHEDIYVACMNSTGNVTLGGGIPAVKKLCKEYPTKLKEIRVNSAFHTPHMRPVKEEFVSRLEQIYEHRMARDDVTLYSTVKGDAYQGPYDPSYWWDNLGHRVNFVDACKSIFRDHGSDVIFLEIGASATLLGNVRQTAKFMDCSPQGYINCGMRSKDDRVTALKATGTLHGMGFPINWSNITRNAGKYLQLPTYPFQGNYYRLESELFRKKRLWQYKQTYRSDLGEINIQMLPFLTDYKLNGEHVVPAAGYIEYLSEMAGQDVAHIKDIKVKAAGVVPQRMRNGGYESLWVVPEVDGSQVTLKEKTTQVQHASAELAKKSASEDELMLDVEALDETCQRVIPAEDLYESFSRAGLKYGSQFKVVTEVKVMDGEAIGYVRSSQSSRHEIIQTVTLDGAFQVALAAFSKGAAYTVTEMASLKMMTDAMPLAEDLVVYTRLSDWELETFTCDLTIADLDGTVLLIAQDVKFETAAKPTTDVQSCLYTTNLETIDGEGQLSTKPWLIIHGREDATLANTILKTLPKATLMSRKEFRASTPQSETNVLYLWNPKDAKTNTGEEGSNEVKPVADIINDASNFPGQPRINLVVVTPTTEGENSIDASLVQGYVRSMSNARSSVSLRGITIVRSSDEAAMASDVILALKKVEYSEVTVDGGKLLQPVVSRLALTQHATTSTTKDWALSKEQEGGFKSLTPAKLDEKEVRIRVRALSRAHQGLLQCAGVVEDIGSAVTSVSVGEAILGLMCSSVASIATCKEDYVVAKPEKLTWSEASAFGFTSAVAYHALKDMIKIKAGDTVYVADAEKPLGQAVVRVAKVFGASIMCSGDPAALAKMFGVVTVVDPTSLAFTKDILQHTGGRGLDVAIATNGESVPQTLIDCTRVAGKVAVMGFTPSRVVIDPKVTTCIINARDFINRRASRLRECVSKAVALLEAGELVSTPLPQLTVSSSGITNDMVSINIPEGFSPTDASLPALSIRGGATCVVVGGMGHVGLEVATWLARHGAKHIALVSQNGMQNIHQAITVEHLKEDHQVQVYQIKANVGNPSEVKMVFESLRQSGAPKVGSIFHAAASMQDVTKSGDDSAVRLINSQAKSALYFHQETTTRGLKLDYFVTFSSAVTLLGLPKMAAWSAACNALSDLSALRKKQGLRSLSLQMGTVSGVGYMERNPDVARAMEAAGVKPLMIQQYLGVLETLLQATELPPTVTVVNQDWDAASNACPESKTRFDEFVTKVDPIEAKKARRSDVQRRLVTFLGDELYWSYSTFKEDVPLGEYGMDLILTRVLTDWLRDEFHFDLEFKDIKDGVTVRSLVDSIMATEA